MGDFVVILLIIGYVVFSINFLYRELKEYIILGKELKRSKPRYTKKEHKELEKIIAEGTETIKKHIMKTRHLSLYGTRIVMNRLRAEKK